MANHKPELKDYYAFVRVAQASGFTAAARMVDVPVSVLSRRVARLERSLGTELLDRTKRSARLTEAGRLIFSRCVEAIETLDAVPRLLDRSVQEPAGILRVSLPMATAWTLSRSCFGPFLERYPAIRLIGSFGGDPHDIIDGTADIVLTAEPPVPGDYSSEELLSDVLGFYAAPQYLEEHGFPESPDELAAHAFLGYDSDPQGRCELALEGPVGPTSVTLETKASFPSYVILKELLLDGAGIALLPRGLTKALLKADDVCSVLDEWHGAQIALWAVWSRSGSVLPKTEAFIRFLQSNVQVLLSTATSMYLSRQKAG